LALVIGNDARLAVDLHKTSDKILRYQFLASAQEKARHSTRPVNWVWHGRRLPAPVGSLERTIAVSWGPQ